MSDDWVYKEPRTSAGQGIADQVDCATSCCFLVVHSLKVRQQFKVTNSSSLPTVQVHPQLKMTNKKSIRCFSVAYCGSYVTNATQDWPLGAPTKSYCRLTKAAQRSKQNRKQKFDGSLSVSSTGLHLSVAGKAVEYPLSTVQGCKSYWPAPASLFWKKGADYVNHHYPVVFELVTRLNDAEGTLQCHLLICQEKGDADALYTSTYKQMKRQRLEEEPHVWSSLLSGAKRAASLVAHRLTGRHLNSSKCLLDPEP